MNELGKSSLSWDIIKNANIGIWRFELEEGKPARMYVDEKMAELIGVTGDEAPEEIYESWHRNIDDDYRSNMTAYFKNMVAGNNAELQYIWHHPNGRSMIIRCGGSRNYSYTEGIRLEGCHQDVTKLVQLQKFHSVDLLAALSDKFAYVYLVDPVTGEYDSFTDGNVMQINSILLKEKHGKDFYEDAIDDIRNIVIEEDQERVCRLFSRENMESIAKGGQAIEGVVRWKGNGDKGILWVKDRLTRFIDELGNPKIIVGIEDITAIKLQEEAILEAREIERKSLIDPLTGCNNRLALEWAYHGGYESQSSVTVISCDLNGLKKVNDKDGHYAGDKFICDVAYLLSSVFGKQCVYRIGGDEFVVVLLSISETEVQALVDSLRERSQQEQICVSVGVAFTTDATASFENLLIEADQKMYEEKREYYRKTGVDRRSRSEMHRKEAFIDAMIDYGSLCYMACKINLTTDSYEIIHIMDGFDTSFRETCVSFSDLLYYPVKIGVMHRDDEEDYLQYTNLEFLRGFATAGEGRSDHWIRYRSKHRRNEYHLIEVQFFFGREYTQNNQVGYAIMKDMGAPFSSEKVRFGEVLKGLSEGFDSIFYVDFKEDVVHPYRVSRDLNETMASFTKTKPAYWDCMKRFIDASVCVKDRELMEKICCTDYLREQFKLRKAFSQDFRVVKNGNEIFYRIKFANMDNVGEMEHCVIGFENINREAIFNRDYRKTGDHLLIVEDNPINRTILKEIFQDRYDVYEAEDGRAAIRQLEDHYEDIALVLTDLMMPNSDGFELIGKIRNDRKFCDIPIIVTTAYGEDISRAKCLELGASDFVSKPYNPEVLKSRVSNLIKLRGVTDTLSRIETDSVTGLYAKEAFFNYAQDILDQNPDKEYSLIVSDIVGFKGINEQYGIEAGNRLLKYVATSAMINDFGMILAGRIGSDIMAVLISEFHATEEKKQEYIKRVMDNAPIPNLIIKYGAYHTSLGRNVKIQQMCDRARIAVISIKGEYGRFFATYDKEMGQKMRMEQMILKSMEAAIEEEQLEIYYQPKFNVSNNQIAGAEALVRWIHPELGFMNPGVFIEIFEKNGFIKKMDRYVWNKVCQDIAEWRKQGVEIPVSVNVSRRDFSDVNLAQYITELTDSYGIPHQLLHIEVTESAYSENPEMLKDTIAQLHESGFMIELDDFGTGYSSITALNSMEIDILKLDLSIIRDDNQKKESNVLDFTMNLAKMMKVQTVQEGVETLEQLERVKSLGCTYVQGYYFAKPLPKQEFVSKFIEK